MRPARRRRYTRLPNLAPAAPLFTSNGDTVITATADSDRGSASIIVGVAPDRRDGNGAWRQLGHRVRCSRGRLRAATAGPRAVVVSAIDDGPLRGMAASMRGHFRPASGVFRHAARGCARRARGGGDACGGGMGGGAVPHAERRDRGAHSRRGARARHSGARAVAAAQRTTRTGGVGAGSGRGGAVRRS